MPGLPRLQNYELLLELASGGMGKAYVARKSSIAGVERLVVVKRIHPHLLTDAPFVEMFRDEARIASLIHHANVVPMNDVVSESGELAVVLEYVESVSLSILIERAATAGVTLPLAVRLRVVADALAGLHAAHETQDLQGRPLDVVHRDVSPQNIIVGTDGVSRIIDFGIAKARGRATSTGAGVIKGKPRYMSPEQVRQRSLDRRADIFAIGVVLHELLTGRRLFHGEDPGDLAMSVLLGEVPSVASEAGSALDAIAQRALARDRDDRYPTAAEMLHDIESASTLAPSREVARCLERLCGETLATRREALRRALAGRVPAGNEALEPTQSITATAVPPARWPRAAVLVAAVGVTGALVWVGTSRGRAVATATTPREATSIADGGRAQAPQEPGSNDRSSDPTSSSVGTSPSAGHWVLDGGAKGRAGVKRSRPSNPELHGNPYGR